MSRERGCKPRPKPGEGRSSRRISFFQPSDDQRASRTEQRLQPSRQAAKSDCTIFLHGSRDSLPVLIRADMDHRTEHIWQCVLYLSQVAISGSGHSRQRSKDQNECNRRRTAIERSAKHVGSSELPEHFISKSLASDLFSETILGAANTITTTTEAGKKIPVGCPSNGFSILY